MVVKVGTKKVIRARPLLQHCAPQPAPPPCSYTHEGSYEGLPGAWPKFVGELLPTLGRPVAGPMLEVYEVCDRSSPEGNRTLLQARLG